ncbi:MAG: twin-arginine translocation signal domain-containing protein [Bryobacteraceae bacterium]|nr:twin-arginine translocation signal domain-containing protein [Bryobacteraceae bacterium]
MLNRRDFIRAGAMATAGAAAGLEGLGAPARMPQSHFGLHPFIERNPKAVFIRRTKVPHKMHEESKLREGLALAREIFVSAIASC